MMKKSVYNQYYLIIFIGIAIFVYVYRVINNYMVKSCQNKYGFAYNVRRKALGVPIIPGNWHIKERDKEFIWWTDKESTIGHSWKTIAFSGCDIDGELDSYTLPKQNGKGRWLEIEYKHRIKPHRDSLVYTYQIEDSAKEISKNVADSIFKSENIVKDY